MMQYEPETICPEIAVVETVANGFTCSCPPLQLVPSLCTHCRPITGCDAGVSVTIFTAISPVFDEEKVCARALPGWTVPANGSTWFCDGSTMPPQLMVRAPARARTHAADTRKGMSRFYTEGPTTDEAAGRAWQRDAAVRAAAGRQPSDDHPGWRARPRGSRDARRRARAAAPARSGPCPEQANRAGCSFSWGSS